MTEPTAPSAHPAPFKRFFHPLAPDPNPGNAHGDLSRSVFLHETSEPLHAALNHAWSTGAYQGRTRTPPTELTRGKTREGRKAIELEFVRQADERKAIEYLRGNTRSLGRDTAEGLLRLLRFLPEDQHEALIREALFQSSTTMISGTNSDPALRRLFNRGPNDDTSFLAFMKKHPATNRLRQLSLMGELIERHATYIGFRAEPHAAQLRAVLAEIMLGIKPELPNDPKVLFDMPSLDKALRPKAAGPETPKGKR